MNEIFSIGYGSRPWQEMRTILLAKSCRFLIDVRSSPYSKFHPEYSRDQLESNCTASGIKYVFMGDTVGGKPNDPMCFDEDGRVNYSKVAATEKFQSGLSRLKIAAQIELVSFLMCSESKPEMCHRCKLIGTELFAAGVRVIHVDENGIDISQGEAMERLIKGQDDMFGSPQASRSRGSYGGTLL